MGSKEVQPTKRSMAARNGKEGKSAVEPHQRCRQVGQQQLNISEVHLSGGDGGDITRFLHQVDCRASQTSSLIGRPG
jgi:hypothetical protein